MKTTIPANKNVRPVPNVQQDDKSVRDASRKVLLKDLDCLQDSIDVNAVVYNAEQLSNMIEEEVRIFMMEDL
jgi:hypothetical protein